MRRKRRILMIVIVLFIIEVTKLVENVLEDILILCFLYAISSIKIDRVHMVMKSCNIETH
jgi:hypothetical protein